MKKILLGACLAFINSCVYAQNGLENIIVEKYYISNAADAAGATGFGDALPAGSTTYRIYVDMLPGYKFQAVFGTQDVSGIPLHTLKLMTTTSFYNNTDRGHEIPSFSKTNAAQHTTMLDSYFSCGAACATGAGPTYNYGILKADDGAAGGANVVNANGILQNNDPNAGIPLTTADGIYGVSSPPVSDVTFVNMAQQQLDFDAGPSSSSFISSNASWASLAGATGPTSDNKVLIGQFTTNGCFSFELNVQIGTPGGGVQNYVAANPVGNEILLPSLVYNKAAVSISANPPGAVCSGTSITFTATPVNGGATPVYQWKKGSTIVGTNSPTYTVSNLANGNLIKCVLTSNASICGTTTATSNIITANISPLPTATITPTGPTTFCSGTNQLTLTASSGAGNIYQWMKGATNLAGATNISYMPTSSGTYKVKITNSNGCSKTSAGVVVTVNALPTATVTVTGPTTFCSGANLCTLTANSGTGLTYQWRKNLTDIAGATNISYVPTATNTKYNVVVTNSNGCTKKSTNTSVTVNPLPSATITPQGPTTFCAGGSVVLQANSGAGLTYQWKKGANDLAGATMQNYTATTGGNYKVVVTNANGCSKTSATTVVTVNCRTADANATVSEGQLSIFPNPTSGLFTLEIRNSSLEDGAVRIEIINTLGQTVYSGSTEISNGELNQQITPGSEWSKGIYFVKVLSGDVIYEGKVLFQ